MFDDHLVKNQALLDYKKSLFGKVAILEFFLTLWIYFKIKKLLFDLLLDEIRLEIMFDDHLVKNRALLHYKKTYLVKWPYWNFSKGGTLWIYFKIEKLLLGLLLDEICLDIMFDDHLVTNQDLLNYKKSLFGQVAI